MDSLVIHIVYMPYMPSYGYIFWVLPMLFVICFLVLCFVGFYLIGLRPPSVGKTL